MGDIISVIVPIYNSENTLRRCVASIQDSSYHALEIILVDDGSTDASGNICDSLKIGDERIKAFHLPNGGVSRARNFGLQNASGDFVAFIDSDDYVGPEYFEELKRTLTQESQMAVGSVAYVEGEKIRPVFAQEGQVDFDRASERDRTLFGEWNRLFLLYAPYNKLYLKKIIQENRIMFPEDTSYGEDLLFNVQYIKCIHTISYRQQPVYYYVNSGSGSLSKKYRDNRFENGLRLNLALKELFEQKRFFSSEEEKFVYQRIFDDAYNAIFDLWNSSCKMNMRGKIQKIRCILSHEDVIHACCIAETEMYSKAYVFLMKKRMCKTFVILREAKQFADRLRHT